jgi:flagellar motor switch protein FliN/FliY
VVRGDAEVAGPRPVARPFTALADVPCPVSIVLGTGTISVRDCLAIAARSVLRLKQPAGEDLQVVVNGVTVARGEVVIIEDSTAVRLTEIAPRPQAESTP